LARLSGEFAGGQHRPNPADAGGKVLEDVPAFAIAARLGKDRPPGAVLINVIEIVFVELDFSGRRPRHRFCAA
jgi:hypothetical protein